MDADTLIPVSFDRVQYTEGKPKDWGAIRSRLKKPETRFRLKPSDICEAIRRGCTMQPGVCEVGYSDAAHVVEQQIFGVDFDGCGVMPSEALGRLDEAGFRVLCWYETWSSKPGDWRFRVLSVLDEPVGLAESRKILDLLHRRVFPEADQACNDPARIFAAGKGPVYEFWRRVGGVFAD